MSRFSSAGCIATKLIELSSLGNPPLRQTPKIGQIWEICKSKAVEPYGRHQRQGLASLCMGLTNSKLLIDRHTEGNINTNEQFQTNVRLQNCENYSSTKLFQISVFKIPWQWQQSSKALTISEIESYDLNISIIDLYLEYLERFLRLSQLNITLHKLVQFVTNIITAIVGRYKDIK